MTLCTVCDGGVRGVRWRAGATPSNAAVTMLHGGFAPFFAAEKLIAPPFVRAGTMYRPLPCHGPRNGRRSRPPLAGNICSAATCRAWCAVSLKARWNKAVWGGWTPKGPTALVELEAEHRRRSEAAIEPDVALAEAQAWIDDPASLYAAPPCRTRSSARRTSAVGEGQLDEAAVHHRLLPFHHPAAGQRAGRGDVEQRRIARAFEQGCFARVRQARADRRRGAV